MSLIHGGARSFGRAKVDSVTLESVPTLGVSCEGEDNKKGVMSFHTIPCFNKYLPDTHYIDVFNKGVGSLKWKATPSEPWILIDKKPGKHFMRIELRFL